MNIRITGFKLRDGGRGGIEIDAEEYFASGQWTIVDKVKRQRLIMISDELKKKISKLKYYYLNLTGHWIDAYNNFFDDVALIVHDITSDSPNAHLNLRTLWQFTEITGAKKVKNTDGFIITGKFEVVEGKPIGVVTPSVTSEDDVGFYLDAIQLLDEILIDAAKEINKMIIPLEKAKESVPLSERQGLTDEELTEKVIEKLHNQGAIIVMEKGQERLNEKNDESIVHESTKSIDSHHKPEAETVEDDDQQKEEGESPADKKADPFGPPAADIPADITGPVPTPKEGESVPTTGEDLSQYEHSESMGIEDNSDVESGEDDEW